VLKLHEMVSCKLSTCGNAVGHCDRECQLRSNCIHAAATRTCSHKKSSRSSVHCILGRYLLVTWQFVVKVKFFTPLNGFNLLLLLLLLLNANCY